MSNSTQSMSPAYIDAYSGSYVVNVGIAFPVLEVVFFALRIISKVIGRSPFGLDDWLMLPAFVLCIGLDVLAFSECITQRESMQSPYKSLAQTGFGGVGRHFPVLVEYHPDQLSGFLKGLIVVPSIYAASTCLPRLVILGFYLRIFVNKTQRLATYTLMALLIALALATILAAIFQCNPVRSRWDLTVHGHCFNVMAYFRYATLPNVILDFFMMCLPWPAVLSLQQKKEIKAGIAITLLAGSLGMIFSIVRTVEYFDRNLEADISWSIVPIQVWCTVEAGCYFLAACLICLRPLVKRVSRLQHKQQTTADSFALRPSPKHSGISKTTCTTSDTVPSQSDAHSQGDDIPVEIAEPYTAKIWSRDSIRRASSVSVGSARREKMEASAFPLHASEPHELA